MSEPIKTQHKCESCPLRARAEANPKSLIARFWRWHTTWCPGWKAYQADLAKQK
ncbi:MAG: hypothetical protein HXY41_02715 [Chloroflexi bacterium]|nr:hypothetical protein [Chloroflexota bacterium]